MSFPRYPKYKDSGVEWLGAVPGHWGLRRLKHNLRLLTEKTDRRENPVALENIEGWTGRFISTNTEFQGEGVAFTVDDILFGKLRPYLAKAYRAVSPGEAVGDFHVMRPISGTDSRFAQYQILNRTFIDIVDGSTFGSKMPRASWEFVGGMVVTTPPISEQVQIANFLDRETAKIDALVSEQRRLMDLLKEKRQAVISHAVTKGLNPDAPMKPSGIDWLGDVPAHWLIAKSLRYFKVAMGQTILMEDLIDDGEWPVFSATDGDHYFGYVNDPKVRLGVGDIVIPARGNSIGAVKLVKEPSTTTQTTIYCKNLSNGQLSPSFVFYFFKGCRDNLFYFTQTAIPQITVEEVGSNPVLIPPGTEQLRIADFLDSKIAIYDALTTEAQLAIDLLQERRTALISAAVTGQIDVRGTSHSL